MPLPNSSHAILVTGATGMVGARVLAEFSRAGIPCAVIARDKASQSATQRIDELMQRFELAWSCDLPRPRVFVGDVTQPRLGLDSRAMDWVSRNCDQILHSAASLNFAPASENPDNEPFRTNILGTQNVLDLFRETGLKHLHHISTAYVCGLRSGHVAESENAVGQSFANDYEQSKSQAESILSTRLSRESHTTYRPSIVIDPIGLTPVSGDRTIYGAYSMYKMLASRFGLPADGQWFRNLGFGGDERKNLIDVNWIAQAIRTIVMHPEHHGRNYHLTATSGTRIELLDRTFYESTRQWLAGRKVQTRPKSMTGADSAGADAAKAAAEIDQLAQPFVKTFLPYFRDDPVFGRSNIDHVIETTPLSPPPEIGRAELMAMVENWSAPTPKAGSKLISKSASSIAPQKQSPQPSSLDPASTSPSPADDPIVICGYAVRLPGGIDDADDFEALLYRGGSAIARMPDDRLDRSLYMDLKRGVPGKTYTEIGGCVDPTPIDREVESKINRIGDFDLTHRQFAQVAYRAMQSTGATMADIDCERTGVFVGHSGGTEDGGSLALSTLAQAAADLANQSTSGTVPAGTASAVSHEIVQAVRQDRPRRGADHHPELNAYAAASLAARLLGFQGRREVIDAACSSSLLALHHAASAIIAGRMDVALVGGATYNNVDNLALFSRTHACSDQGSFPFDQRASGLVSSEGYVAIILSRRSVAEAAGMKIHATLEGVGISSDGKGKGLWAPRSEGQQLAMRRGAGCDTNAFNHAPPLDIDYLECHATSTQVGDATELESLTALLSDHPQQHQSPLPIGSVKSNLGHLLEAAGLVGMVKCLIAMRRGEIPASINFSQPTKSFDWSKGVVRVVDRTEPWQVRGEHSTRRAAVNAFGIGGLNAHAAFRQYQPNGSVGALKLGGMPKQTVEPIAIVGRGLVLPGAASVGEFESLLQSGRSVLGPPPPGRWPTFQGRPIGLALDSDADFTIPHHHGGYIQDFQFDAQAYRIPPKLVANANPAQLMLIDAVSQAMKEFDGGQWNVDRQRVGVIVGSMFGGQFSNELQIGLRLPELCQHLIRAAMRRGVDLITAQQWAAAYHEAVMERYPALLDETGGFTASTLASRIARTFDLMGGACAVDADEASGGLAILTAIEQLQSGSIDTVLCGTTQRSMDLVALEQLYRNHRLCCSVSPEDLPLDGTKIFPAEGVAIIVLQRLSDAKAQGRKIYGVIENARESFTPDPNVGRARDASRSQENDVYSTHQLVRQIGHLGGGHGVVRTIAATIAANTAGESSGSAPASRVVCVAETASDGYQIEYQVSTASESSMSRSQQEPIEMTVDSTTQPASDNLSSSPARVSVNSVVTPLSVRLEVSSASAMQQALEALSAGDAAMRTPAALNNGTGRKIGIVSRFSDPSHIQAAIVARDENELQASARALLDGPVSRGESASLQRHCGWVRFPSSISGQRIAWLFPGQGSQYAGIPASLTAAASSANSGQPDELLSRSLAVFDAELTRLGLQPIADRITDPQRQLGKEVWWTQAWLLAVGTALAQSQLSRGHRPDVVIGHSFGECTAAWCAGAMTTRQAIEFAKSRADAVVMSGGPRGQLLSVRGGPSQVDAVLRSVNSECVITHHNSPQQTVIAGTPEQIAAAQKALSKDGAASVVIPVPAAFHTPGMKPARDMLAARQAGASLLPPRFGFLSSIENRYLAEPGDVLNNLIDQLVRPVCFSSSIERASHDGCGLMVEIGPNNILTRLASATVGGKSICLSADDPNLDNTCQTQVIELAYEAFGAATIGASQITVPSNHASGHPSTASQAVSVAQTQTPDATQTTPAKRFDVVDVTRRGRTRTSADDQDDVNRDSGSLRSTSSSATAVQPTSHVSYSTNTAVAQPEVAPVVTHSVATMARENVGGENAAAKKFLFDLIVDLTGYEPEIIDFEADLEAELGVDSIKKAQLIGELVQWADLSLTTQDLKLADFQSLADILALAGPATESVPAPTSSQAVVVASPVSAEPDQSVDPESLRRLMIDLLVDQTGYDEDIIDMEADLESELGVDSIKRAQLLGELEQQFELPPIQGSDLRLSDFPTLASIHQFVMDQVGGEKKKSSALNDSAVSATEVVDEHVTLTKPVTPRKTVKPDSEIQNAPVKVPVLPIPATGTHRFTLTVRDADRRDGMPTAPKFHGPALVIGNNPIADAIIRRWAGEPYAIEQIKSVSLAEIDGVLDQVWSKGFSHHVFLTTPHDAIALTDPDDFDHWQRRREDALMVPYRICQRWMQRAIDEDRISESSLVTFLNAGGAFGFDLVPDIVTAGTPESGGLSGLTKAMLIECWMRGYRDTPMLIVDAILHNGDSVDRSDLVVDGVWRELAVPSYDEEVAVSGPTRRTIQAIYQPIPQAGELSPIRQISTRYPLTRGGTWVVAGGGRGITAMTAMELAQRHDLTLHLLGMAPIPEIDAATRAHAQADRADLRRCTMKRIQAAGGNPVKTWRQLEKAIEIDLTLDECRRRGIRATYHSVDVCDAGAVAAALDEIRKIDGPIHGVIQGAGSGQDARFDRKRPDKVDQCLKAKIDGTIALAAATKQDPLEWFVGFGSISGRFGANGHTDYSAANEMLSKLIGQLGRKRPDTRCVTFHWHAWGDIGMATKPEAKLALDMIGMEFMPAAEGLSHFLSELENGGDDSEVLITDRRYVRKFFPNEPATGPKCAPMIAPQSITPSQSGANSFAVTLSPGDDLFLKEHLVNSRPTLPMVMAAEMLAEAAQVSTSLSVIRLENLRAIAPLKSSSDDSFAVELVRDDAFNAKSADGLLQRWSLQCDLRRKDGRLVQAGRPHFTADLLLAVQRPAVPTVSAKERLAGLPIAMNPVPYLPADAPIYHGPSLQNLRSIGFTDDAAVGVIVTPSPSHLAGESRPVHSWVISPATVDAMLYASGMMAGHVAGRPSLPISIDAMDLGRLPDPGEPLRVVVRWLEQSETGAKLQVVLSGQNHDLIVRIRGYQIGWLG
ncbi:type I polyketide synthase [Stieleria varia]|uniref:Phthiocerol synthesis polyketide synthase type I PpsC n=1 Tax=Stieleria varia TaxID=2528005 RepID=A0A5C6BAM2_9BACT|nr:type I polyketide synthase [Stieleria varia]TWU08316.1 Phthiocerol synthesis polyketide synthase type I PpsC [Stieleria varia]